MITGLLGRTLGYSYSAIIFKQFFEKNGIRAEYRLFERSPEQLLSFFDSMKKNVDLLGCNVTIPYKKAVISYLDHIDNEASGIGAVNCIHKKDGMLCGTNTDYLGFLASIEDLRMNAYEKCLVLGSGGASSAVIHALKKIFNGEIYVWNRSQKAFEDQAAWKGEAVDLLINCTPLGTDGYEGDFPRVIYEVASHARFYYDLVYNPSHTRMMLYLEEKGIETRNGLAMLIEQASLAAELWFGKTFSRNFKAEMKEFLTDKDIFPSGR